MSCRCCCSPPCCKYIQLPEQSAPQPVSAALLYCFVFSVRNRREGSTRKSNYTGLFVELCRHLLQNILRVYTLAFLTRRRQSILALEIGLACSSLLCQWRPLAYKHALWTHGPVKASGYVRSSPCQVVSLRFLS